MGNQDNVPACRPFPSALGEHRPPLQLKEQPAQILPFPRGWSALPGSGQSLVTDVPGRSETHTAPRVTSPLSLLLPATSGLSAATLGCSSPRIRQEQTHSEHDAGHVSSLTQDVYAGKSNFCISNARNFL